MENLVEKTSSSLVDNLRPFLESYIKNHMKTIVKNQEIEKENYEYMLNLPIVMDLNKKIVMMQQELNVKDIEIKSLKQALNDAKNRIDLVIKEKNVENYETLEQKQQIILTKHLIMKMQSTRVLMVLVLLRQVLPTQKVGQDKMQCLVLLTHGNKLIILT